MALNLDSRVIALCNAARKSGILSMLGMQGPAGGVADMGALFVSGKDAAEFLHSQLTNEVKALKPGEGNFSARVTRTGALVRWFSLHCIIAQQIDPTLPDNSHGYVLLLEREGIPSLRADLEKFAISDDVTFTDISEKLDFIALQGPQAPLVAEAALGKLGTESWSDLVENNVRPLPAGALGFARSLTGDSGYIIAIPKESGWTEEIFDRLKSAGKEKGIEVLSDADFAAILEILRTEAGIVRVGIDAPEAKLVLPDTGLEQQVVSYSKGCYLGQEIIARIRTYGSVPFVLRGLVFELSSPSGKAAGGEGKSNLNEQIALLKKLPPIGDDVILESGQKAGHITSRTISPVLDAPIAYAYLDRANRTPGTKLKIKAKDGSLLSARVELLPFYRAADLKSRVSFLHDRAIRIFSEGNDDKAIEFLVEALRLDPSFSDGYEALGVILGRTGRFHEAIGIFKQLEEVAPNEPMVNTNLSLYYMKIGDKQTAEDEKARATVKQFSRFGAMKKEEQRQAEEAAQKKADAERKKAMFSEVLEIDPEDPIALFGLGNALSNLGDWAEAEIILRKAIAVQKDNSAVYVAHGKALEALNREVEALAVYREGMAVASRKGDLMPLKEMERRALLLEGTLNSRKN